MSIEDLAKDSGKWASYLCHNLNADDADALDAVQDAFVRLIRSPPAHTRNLQAYWKRALRHSYFDLMKKKRPTTDYDISISVSPEQSLAEFEETANVVLQGLPELRRAIFLDYAVSDLTSRQLAEKYGVPKGTIVSNISRAREYLRSNLSPNRRQCLLQAIHERAL